MLAIESFFQPEDGIRDTTKTLRRLTRPCVNEYSASTIIMRSIQLVLIFTGLLLARSNSLFAADAIAPFPVTITVDAGRPAGDLPPIWRFFGADEPNYAYMKDGKKLLGELGQLGGPQVYFR